MHMIWGFETVAQALYTRSRGSFHNVEFFTFENMLDLKSVVVCLQQTLVVASYKLRPIASYEQKTIFKMLKLICNCRIRLRLACSNPIEQHRNIGVLGSTLHYTFQVPTMNNQYFNSFQSC